jgi:hypothetical protein
VTGEDTRKLSVSSDVVRPVVEHATYQDQVKRGDKHISKFLNESDTKRLDRHKKAGTLLSLSSGTLGLAALGTRAPAVARAAGNKGVKGLSRLASHEAKATSLSNTLGVGAIGVGSAGSFNYAAQQKLERKRDAVNKAVYRGMSVNGAKRALKSGLKASADGDIGPGVYTTPDLRVATSYANPQGNGNKSLRGHKGKRIGRVVTINDEGLSPVANGKPQDLGFGGFSMYDQRTFREGQITRDRIVHVQNVNRTTDQRLQRRLDPYLGGNPNAVVKGMPRAVSKAQIVPGIYRPIMHISEETNKLETSRPVVDALRARLKGAPVYHGGTSERVNNLRRGKSVDMKTRMFGKEPVKGLWTTPRRDMASQYAVAGRTPENFHKYGEEAMSSEAVARTKKGKVAEYNMKGVWPVAGWAHEDKSAFVYKPQDLDGRLVRVHGQKRTRDAETRLRGAEDVSRQSTFNQSGVGKSMPTYGWLKRTGEKVRIMRPHGTSGHFLVDSPRGTLITHRDDMRFATAKQTRLSPESPRAAAARAKQPEQLSMFEKSFLSRYRDRISPNAEAGYRHLRSERNENAASAIGNTSLAGLSAGVLAHEGHTLSRPAAALTGAGGLAAAYTALHSARTAKRRQTSMKKIEQKAHARAALGLYGPDRGKTPVDMSSARAKKTGAAS